MRRPRQRPEKRLRENTVIDASYKKGCRWQPFFIPHQFFMKRFPAFVFFLFSINFAISFGSVKKVALTLIGGVGLLADASIASANISTCFWPDITKFFVILEVAIRNTFLVSMAYFTVYILPCLYCTVLSLLSQQNFYEFFPPVHLPAAPES